MFGGALFAMIRYRGLVMAKIAKRVAIVCFYDPEGIVDEFVSFFLQNLKSYVNRLIVVCNGGVNESGCQQLSEVSDELYFRDNTGLIALAYKHGIETVGWASLAEYDDLILANTTCFGPVFSLGDFFAALDASDKGLYGIFRANRVDNVRSRNNTPNPYGYNPEGPISNFYVVRSNFLHSPSFKRFWDELPKIEIYDEVTMFYEYALKILAKNEGFGVDAYQGKQWLNRTDTAMIRDSYGLLAESRIPLFRRRDLTSEPELNLRFNYNDNNRKAVDFIDSHTDYPTEYIWDNVFRTMNQYDYYHQLQTNWVIHDCEATTTSCQQSIGAIGFVTYNQDGSKTDKALACLANLPTAATSVIVPLTHNALENAEHFVRQVPVTNMSISTTASVSTDGSIAIIQSCVAEAKAILGDSNHKLTCVFNDSMNRSEKYLDIWWDWYDRCLETTLGSKGIVCSIGKLFDSNERLGVLAATPPYHADYLTYFLRSWASDYTSVSDACKHLGIGIPIDANKPPVAPWGNVVWYRTDVLRKILDSVDRAVTTLAEGAENGCTIVRRIHWLLALLAQSQNYLSGYVRTADQARTDLTNYEYMLRSIAQAVSMSNSRADSYDPIIKLCRSTFGSVVQ
jgi:rhamnosyltransferase